MLLQTVDASIMSAAMTKPDLNVLMQQYMNTVTQVVLTDSGVQIMSAEVVAGVAS